MKKFLLIFIFAVMAAAVYGDLPQEPMQRVSPEDFCIMPWNLWAETEFQPEDYDLICKEMSECGFNVTGMIQPQFAHYAEKYKLKTQLLFDRPPVENNFEENAKKWAENIKNTADKSILENAFQIHVRDEPFIDDLEEMSAYRKACKHILGVRPYINFNPNKCPKEVIGDSYETYCDSFIKGAELDFISYDRYALYNDTGLDEDKFYCNLEEIRKVALKNNVRFMNVILSVQHFNYGRPDDVSIALQGFSSLAYGAKGLSYFTLIAPARGDFRNSPYDRYGHRTDLWYAIRNMNFAIHNLSPTYCRLKNINVFHVGNIPEMGRG
ncbi:MAG: hypothetical protein KBT47_07205, partial [Armatimonadetes bacterium]|nr:hypothetical protein [Candidatus Hippobium faecium]